jgi:hypothetical protein
MPPLECLEEVFEAAKAGQPVVCSLSKGSEAEPAMGLVKYFEDPGIVDMFTGATLRGPSDTLNGALTQWQRMPQDIFGGPGGFHVQTVALIWIYRLKPSEPIPGLEPPSVWLNFTNPNSSERSIHEARCADTQGHQATLVGRDNLGEVWSIHLLAFPPG